MKLSILICGLQSRIDSYNELMKQLQPQCEGLPIEILYECDNGEMTVGEKRNKLLNRSNGEYICYIDDDDMISKDYIEQIMDGINRDVDCCSLMGVITTDGQEPEIFEHSIEYNEYKTNPTGNSIRYERYPNHLNTIKSSIAKQFKFPEIDFGEDTDWATQINQSGLLKHQYNIKSVIYHYNYKTNK